MSSGELRELVVTSGVNGEGVGFCHVLVNGGDLAGQMEPGEVRAMAMHWLAAADAAESDAAVFRVLRRTGLGMAEVGALIAGMRDERGTGE